MKLKLPLSAALFAGVFALSGMPMAFAQEEGVVSDTQSVDEEVGVSSYDEKRPHPPRRPGPHRPHPGPQRPYPGPHRPYPPPRYPYPYPPYPGPYAVYQWVFAGTTPYCYDCQYSCGASCGSWNVGARMSCNFQVYTCTRVR